MMPTLAMMCHCDARKVLYFLAEFGAWTRNSVCVIRGRSKLF